MVQDRHRRVDDDLGGPVALDVHAHVRHAPDNSDEYVNVNRIFLRAFDLQE